MSRRKKMMAFFKVYKYALYDIVTIIIISYYLTIWVFKNMGGDIQINYNHEMLWLSFAFVIPVKILLNQGFWYIPYYF